MDNYRYNYQGKKVLITGASGFIGYHLCQELSNQNAKVFGWVRKESNQWRFNDLNSDVKIMEVDLLNMEEVAEFMGDCMPDYIFHLAIPSHSQLTNEEDLRVQISVAEKQLINLFSSFQANGLKIQAFVHACSAAIDETKGDYQPVNEKTRISPSTLRGRV